jgi:ribonuclease P protein component
MSEKKNVPFLLGVPGAARRCKPGSDGLRLEVMANLAGKALRVTGRSDIARIFEHGLKVRDRLMTLAAVRRDGSGPSRGGVAVSSRHGGAVRRNRVKRLCREALRLVRGQLPRGWDFFIIPCAGVNLTLEGLQKSLVTLAAKADAKWQASPATPTGDKAPEGEAPATQGNP